MEGSDMILRVKDFTASYEEFDALKDINLDVKRGEVLCIVGESGSGKSTLIKAICHDPDITVKSGIILYKDKNVVALGARERQKLLGTQIGFIQQNPWGAFNPIRRMEAQFKETFRSHGKEFDRDKVKEIFEVLGLKDADALLKQRPYELSGGMSQRVAICSSFALEPELLLCDEITSALDVTTASAVTEQLLKLKTTMGTTIVLVTHNLGMAKCIADRIAIMYKGRIVESGDVESIMGNPQHEYTKRLLSDVPRLKVV